MKFAFIPRSISRQLERSLLVLVIVSSTSFVLAQAVRIDTVYAEGCPALWEGEPQTFSAYHFSREDQMLLVSDLYRGIFLDNGRANHILAPATNAARKGLVLYDHFAYGLCDSTVVFLNHREAWITFMPERLSLESCTPYAQQGYKMKHSMAGADGLAAFPKPIFLFERTDATHWRCYLPILYVPFCRRARATTHLPPFLIYEISQRGSKAKINRLPNLPAMIPISAAAKANPLFFGSSFIADNARGIWRADNLDPWVRCYDRAGSCLDSVKMASTQVDPNRWSAWTDTIGSSANVARLQETQSYYFGLFANEKYLLRGLHVAGDSNWHYIAYQFATGESRTITLPAEQYVTTLADSGALLSGTRREDRILFGFVSLASLFAKP